MQTTNPLPGMNPYLETSWPDAHVALIGYLRDAIGEQLPMGLRVLGEQDVEIGHEAPFWRFRPDIGVQERNVIGQRPSRFTTPESSIAIAEPEIIEIDPLPHRWIEIRDLSGKLITVIEVLSPWNKEGRGRRNFIEKQLSLLSGSVNLVEIDLIRCGQLAWPPEVTRALKPAEGTRYLIIVSRAMRPNEREIYYCPLRNSLPNINVPLRPTDQDLTIALQPMIDRVYRIGGYYQVCNEPLPAPDLPFEESIWLDEKLREAGLRS